MPAATASEKKNCEPIPLPGRPIAQRGIVQLPRWRSAPHPTPTPTPPTARPTPAHFPRNPTPIRSNNNYSIVIFPSRQRKVIPAQSNFFSSVVRARNPRNPQNPLAGHVALEYPEQTFSGDVSNFCAKNDITNHLILAVAFAREAFDFNHGLLGR
jgi:hypothetical protein